MMAAPAGMGVVCVGLTTLDLVHLVDELPGPDQKVQAVGAYRTVGGPATNAAVTAARLGSPTTLVSRLPPPDALSFFGAREWPDGLSRIDVGTGTERFAVSSIVIDRSGRRSVVSENAVGWGPPADVPPVSGAVLLADGHDPAVLAAVLRISAASVRILDAGSWKPWMAGGGPDGLTMGAFTHVVASADFRAPEPDTVRWLLKQGVTFAAVTGGAGPTVWRAGSGEAGTVDPVPPPAPVLDTLGAGDVLHGAFAHFLAAASDPATDAVPALRSAMEVATWSVGRLGVRAGLDFFLGR